MGSQPDRGYAWIILAASFLCQAASIGYSVGCIGITTLSFSRVFLNATDAELSWIGSLRGSTQFLASLVAMPLAEKFGFQAVTFIGSLLAVIGVVGSIYATELWHVYLGFGIIGGIGISCPYSTSQAILGEYFHKFKHIAFPVVGFGQGVGALVFPPALQSVVDSSGHTNALVMTACIISINALCGLTFKPLESELLQFCRRQLSSGSVTACCQPLMLDGRARSPVNDVAAAPSDRSKVTSDDCDHVALPVSDSGNEAKLTDPAIIALSKKGPHGEQTVTSQAKDSGGGGGGVTSSIAGQRGLVVLLGRWEVWMHILNPLLWGACSSAMEALWPLLAAAHDISDSGAALGVTLCGVGFLAASIVMAALGRRSYDRCLLYLLAATLCGTCILIVPHVPLQLGAYVTLSTLFGWWLGVIVSLFMSVISEVVAPHEFADAIALYNFMNGIGYFIGPVTTGSLSARFGEVVSWTVCGCFSVAASLVLIPPYALSRIRGRKTAPISAEIAKDVEAEAALANSSGCKTDRLEE